MSTSGDTKFFILGFHHIILHSNLSYDCIHIHDHAEPVFVGCHNISE